MIKKMTTEDGEDLLKISELIALSGVSAGKIKHFREEGILPFQPTEASPTRGYPAESSVKRLKKIKQLQEKKRLSIEEIKKVLKTSKQTNPPKE